MICLRHILLLALCIGWQASTRSQDFSQVPRDRWISLFNGKNLDQWTPKITGYPAGENFGQTFRVREGNLVVSYDQYTQFDERFGHLFYQQPFRYYLIRLEYRFLGNQVKGGPGWAQRNSGIMVHGQSPQTMHKDQDFPISIEVQLLGGLGTGPRSTANLCTPGTHVMYQGKLLTAHCINSRSATYDGDQWVRVEVLVLGDSLIRHVVNGETVLEYSQPQIGGGNVLHADSTIKKDGTLLQGGYISLQSESHPVEFRNIELLNLEGCKDPAASNYTPYAVRHRASDCRYPSKKSRKSGKGS